jgi:cell division septum initiation protein DivIVA
VLQLECFPDWKSTPINGNPYTFEAGHKYLNGPEAFLHALLTEYRDARKRYDEIYRQITELVTPPLGFLFDEEARRKRLFEDKHFTWTRRYFYAHQALGNVNDSIKAMIDAFEDTFTDDIWEGTCPTMWPLYEESARNEHWKRRLRLLRLQFEREMKELRILQRENNERRHEIETLQEQLFSGTSIQESRKSVELADVTVHQGYNIKVLTIVNLFFMPLTFVTSIFGMTNMPAEPAPYWPFAITLVAICITFFSIIGFLSTNYGYHMWATKTRQFWRWLRPKPDPEEEIEAEYTGIARKNRSMSTEEGMRMRIRNREQPPRQSMQRPPPTHPHIHAMVERMGEGRRNGLVRMGTLTEVDSETGSTGRTTRDTLINIQEPK